MLNKFTDFTFLCFDNSRTCNKFNQTIIFIKISFFPLFINEFFDFFFLLKQ